MENRKKTFGRKALSFVLAACMLVTTFAPTMATVAYAEDAGTSLVTSSVPTVDEGNAGLLGDGLFDAVAFSLFAGIVFADG